MSTEEQVTAGLNALADDYQKMYQRLQRAEQLVRDMATWMREGYEAVWAENVHVWEARQEALLTRAKELVGEEEQS